MPIPPTLRPSQNSLLALLSHTLLPSEPLPEPPSPPLGVPGHLNWSASQSELTVGLASSAGLPYMSCLILSPFLWMLCFSLANVFVFQTRHVSPALFWCRYCHFLFAHLISTCSSHHFIWEGTSVPPPHTLAGLLICASLESRLLFWSLSHLSYLSGASLLWSLPLRTRSSAFFPVIARTWHMSKTQ